MHSYIKAIRQSMQMLQSYIMGVVEYVSYDNIVAAHILIVSVINWNMITMMGVNVRGSATEATHIRFNSVIHLFLLWRMHTFNYISKTIIESIVSMGAPFFTVLCIRTGIHTVF